MPNERANDFSLSSDLALEIEGRIINGDSDEYLLDYLITNYTCTRQRAQAYLKSIKLRIRQYKEASPSQMLLVHSVIYKQIAQWALKLKLYPRWREAIQQRAKIQGIDKGTLRLRLQGSRVDVHDKNAPNTIQTLGALKREDQKAYDRVIKLLNKAKKQRDL